MSDLFVGDVGTVVTVETSNDLSAATLLELHVRKPSGAGVTWAGALADTTKIQYTILAGDFDEAGSWSLQAYVESPDWTGLGDTATFIVKEPFAT